MASQPGNGSMPAVVRHPLGLPAGSVRALLTLGIAAMFFFYLLMPAEQPTRVPLFLYALLPMMLLFFVAHGRTIRPEGQPGHSPLWLPRGVLRVLLVAAFLAVVGWQIHHEPELLTKRLTPTEEQLPQWPYVLAWLGGGFILGQLARIGPWRRRPAFQDMTAWVSLLALLGLVAEMLIEFVIRPGTFTELNTFVWECVLTGVIAFYFSLRS